MFFSSSVCGHSGVFLLLAIVDNVAMSIDVQISEFLLLILLSIYSEAELLDHMVILFFFLKEPTCHSSYTIFHSL